MSSILIVEDEERIASFIEKGLRANGFATTVAGDGLRGLALADTAAFDLVILDLGLPELDGLSLLRRLRDRGNRVPVVILTARDGVRDTVDGLEAGADELRHEAVPVRGAPGAREGTPAGAATTSRRCCARATPASTCGPAGRRSPGGPSS